jgi:integrase
MAVSFTKAIRNQLDQAMAFSSTAYVFVMEDGTPFDFDSFRKTVWSKSFKLAGIPYQRPYVTRHTFAAWALTIQTDPNKLVNLMGHSTKQMIYETYGQYVEGLEEDAEKIYQYFGGDFIRPERPKVLNFTRVERHDVEANLMAVAV